MTDLHQPTITLIAAALLGLIFAVLCVLVVLQRGKYKVNLGSGEIPAAATDPASSPLLVAVRSQANFAEYVPLILVLVGLIELRTGPTLLVKLLAFGLVLARAMHPLGMKLPAPNPFRAGGFVLSLLILLDASVEALRVTLL